MLLSVADHSARHVPSLARLRFSPILTRVLLYLVTALIALTLNFALPRALPGDPLDALQDPNSGQFISDSAVRARLAAYYGLDQPAPQQYLHYLRDLLSGNFGWSIHFNVPAGSLVRTHLAWTLLLMLSSLLLASTIGLVAGANAGWARGSRLDRVLVTGFLAVGHVPVFVVGVLLLILLSVKLPLFPLAGAETPFMASAGLLDRVRNIAWHLVLPLTSMTLVMVGGIFLLARGSMVSVLGEDFMLVARAKGLSERQLKYRHGLRNAMLPLVTLLSTQVGFAVTGAVFVETLFAYPGMGRLMFEAVGNRDYPVLQAAFLVVTSTVLVANLAADLLYYWLDPRTRPA